MGLVGGGVDSAPLCPSEATAEPPVSRLPVLIFAVVLMDLLLPGQAPDPRNRLV